MKKLIRIALFLIILMIIIQILGPIFTPVWDDLIDPATPRWAEFYSLENNSIDVLAIGASSVGRGYSPVTVWEEYGITSFNLGTSNQTTKLAYYVIEEALESQSPKVIVLDVDAFFAEEDAPDGEYIKLFNNFKLNKVKIKALLDIKVNSSLKRAVSFIFPAIAFHDRWNELEERDFDKSEKKEYLTRSYAGMAVFMDIKPYIDEKDYMGEKGEKAEISKEDLKYIDKIVKLCQEKQIKLLWMEIPCAKSWSLAKSKAVKELADKYNIEFIDYNLEEIRNEVGFDWKTDTADGGNHLNVIGAEKVSRHLGGILKEKYNCQDNRENKKISEFWKEIQERYKAKKIYFGV